MKPIKSPWQCLWGLVWKASECLHVNLGRSAPWVFGQMIGSRDRVEIRKVGVKHG